MSPAPALACDSDSGDGFCSTLSWPVLANGTYCIRVVDWLLDDVNVPYLLSVQVE